MIARPSVRHIGVVCLVMVAAASALSAQADPVIILNGANPLFWECGVPFEDPGAIALDPLEGDISGNIVVTGAFAVDTTVLGGSFTVTYTVENCCGGSATETREVRIVDRVRPVISFETFQNNFSGWQPVPTNIGMPEPGGYTWLGGILNENQIDEAAPDWGAFPSMIWRCDIPFEDPGIIVSDLCEVYIDPNDTEVIITRVLTNDEEESIWAGTYAEINNGMVTLVNTCPSPFDPEHVGYRIRYVAYDTSGNAGYAVRNVEPCYVYNYNLVQPTILEIECGDTSVFSVLQALEIQDRYSTSCEGDITNEVHRTGEIDVNTPGVYHREYKYQTVPLMRRTIIVNDAPPEILMLNETGQTVSGAGAAVDLSWCAFLAIEVSGEVYIRDDFSSWWPAVANKGYFATDKCDDDISLTSDVSVRGMGILADTMLNLATSGATEAENIYSLNQRLWYDVMDPRNNRASAERNVRILYEPPELFIDDNGQRTPATQYFASNTFECGEPIVLPQATVDIDACRVDRLEAEVVDFGGLNLLTPVPGTYQLTYSSFIPANRGITTQVTVTVEDTQAPVVQLNDLGNAIRLGGVWETDCFAAVVDDFDVFDACMLSPCPDCDVTLTRFIWRLIDREQNPLATRVVRDEDGRPVDYGAGNRYLDDPGEYLMVYLAADQAGNTNLPLDENGLPAVFQPTGGLTVFEASGALRPELEQVMRILRVGNAIEFLNFPAQDATGFFLVECGADWDAALEYTEVCAVDTVTHQIWKLNPNGTVVFDGQYPRQYNAADITRDLGRYVVVFIYEKDGVKQPPHIRPQLWLPEYPDILDDARRLRDPGAPYLRLMRVQNTSLPVITLQGNPVIALNCGDAYVEPGFSATDPCEGDLTASVVVNRGGLDTNRTGEYRITYTVADSQGNEAVAHRLVVVTDSAVVTGDLLGAAEMTLECGDVFVDPGAEAFEDGESIPVVRQVDGDFDSLGAEVGETTITYSATTQCGTSVIIGQRTVIVEDTQPPVITLRGRAAITLEVGESYYEAGAVGEDACDGAVPVSITGTVDTTTEGVYTLTYTATDSAGLSAIPATRTVTVENRFDDDLIGEGEIMEGEGEDETPEPPVCGCDEFLLFNPAAIFLGALALIALLVSCFFANC